ncbi:MAG: Crp/Fnr family transcriptional regulator [Pseudomonadota bacterium]
MLSYLSQQKLTKQDTPYTLQAISGQWDDVTHLGKEKCFLKGSIVHYDKSEFFYVKKGTIQLVYTSKDGRERVLVQYADKCIFAVAAIFESAEFAFLHESDTVSWFFRCVTGVELTIFPSSLLLNKVFIAQYPELIINVMYTMSTVTHLAFMLLTSMQMQDVRGKVAKFILSIEKSQHRDALIPNVSQTELATILGVHRGSVARAIAELRSRNIIGAFSKKSVVVLDSAMLRKIAKED